MRQIRERLEAETKLENEFNETRDPIFNCIYRELKQISKWVKFMGIVIILSLIGTILIFMGGMALGF